VNGGRAGSGGFGVPPGLGGISPPGIGVPGPGGQGRERGEDGRVNSSTGNDGTDGQWCLGHEPDPPPPSGHTVGVASEGYDTCGRVLLYPGVWGPMPQSRTSQANEIILGGGAGGDVWPLLGQTMAFAPDGSRLYVCTTQDAIFIYDDPLDGGERPPDVRLTPSGAPEDFRPGAI
jgi:hypothetical protein